jgi:HlyD family secretion protein
MPVTRAKANLGIIDGRIDVLSARVARLKAERDKAGKIGFPEPLQGRRGDPDVDEILRGEEELFSVRRVALEGQAELLEQGILQYEEEIRGLQAQQRSKARQVVLIREELSGLMQLYEKGYVTRSRVLAYERAAEQLGGERGEYISNIARAEKSIAEARLQILQLEKDFRGEVVEELRDLEAKIFDLTRQRVTAVDELKRLEIRAPQSGIVVGTDVHTVGGVIAPAQPILDIVPGDDELVVEARVEPRDIDKLRIGQTAVLRLSAFDLRSTPELGGIVVTVSADRLFDETTGETYYLTRLRIPEAELAKLENLKLVPGMPVETFIDTGERTALSYLLKPFADGLARALRDD